MSIKPISDGFHAITPYLFAQGASRLIEFISAAFDGELTSHQTRTDGAIMHATMRVGDSMIMLADATSPFGPMPASIYLYVRDSDAVYHSALNAGGVSVFPIMTLPSGDGMAASKTPAATFGGWPATSRMFHPTRRSDAGKNLRCPRSRATRPRPNERQTHRDQGGTDGKRSTNQGDTKS
jgi:PhnB protein